VSELTEDVFFGDDKTTDDLADSLFDKMRKFVDHEAIDGDLGLANSWHKRLITFEELMETYTRYENLRTLIPRESK